MLEIQVRSFPRTKLVWFAESAVPPSRLERLASYQLVFIQAQEKPDQRIEQHATISPFTTLLIDLTSSEELLWGGVRKRTREYVKAAAKTPHELKWQSGEHDPRPFDFLVNFCARKGLSIPSKTSYRKHVIDNGVVSSCLVDGEIRALHFYLIDKERRRVRLLWSARALDEAAASITARLNKLLHWRDLLYFRDLSMVTFDWGGIALTDGAIKGVDDFKRGFGGTLVTEWNVSCRSPLYSSSVHQMRHWLVRRSKAR
jgi:hypothetical protein